MSSARPQRLRAAPARFDEEQAALAGLAALAAAERNPAAAIELSGSSSSDSEEEEGPAEDEERKESDRRPPAFPWGTEHSPIRQHAFEPGLRARRSRAFPRDCTTERDFLRLLLPDAFLDSMVDLTNSYAEQRHDGSRAAAAAAEPEAAAAEAPPPTTREEIEALLGCLIYMGIVCMDATRDYWAELTRQPFVSDVFPRDRFLWLLSCLRVSDEGAAAADTDARLAKLHSLISTLEGTLLSHFYPSCHVCVDEAMVAFKGRSVMRQHIAKKRSPTGFKVWMLVDCDSNYVCALDVFTGMKGRRREEGAAGRVVRRLLDRLQPLSWHVVAMDGYFSSVQLFEELLSLGFYAVGTTRHNRRHFPKELLREVEGCERGEWVWRQKRGSPLVATSWMDKKSVNLLSTCADAEQSTTIERRTGSELVQMRCPAVLPLYLRYMRGVDVFAQRQSYSKIGRRSRKWFYSLVWFLIDVAIHNAFILYQQQHNRSSYDEKDYRKALMQQLVLLFTARRTKVRAATRAKHGRDSLHRLAHTSEAGTCQECRRPRARGRHSVRTHWLCEDCNVHLCVPACYNKHIQALSREAPEEEE